MPRTTAPPPTTSTMTPALSETLDAISRFRAEYDASPTYDELADSLGVTKAGIQHRIAALIRLGRVTKDGRSARSLRVVRLRLEDRLDEVSTWIRLASEATTAAERREVCSFARRLVLELDTEGD